MPRNITIIHSSGSEHVSTSDEDSGVQIHSTGSQDDYSAEDSLEEAEEDYDFVDEDELDPSDSASRPRATSSRTRAPPQVRPPPGRRPPAHPPQEAPRRRRVQRDYHRDRSEHSAPRPRPLSVDSDSVDYPDDYPGYPPRGPLPHHPHNQWAHVPQHPGPPTGYPPSIVSGAPFQPNPFGDPSRALVHMPPTDPYGFQQNPFASAHGVPFGSPPPGSMVGGAFFNEPQRPGLGRQRHSIHGGMPGQPAIAPAGAMMPFYQGYDQHYQMPPQMAHAYGYGPYHRSPHNSPPPLRERSRSKPRTPPAPPPPPPVPTPGPVVPMAPPAPPPPPEPTPAEKDAAERLRKLEELLMAQAEAQARKEASKRQAAEDAKLAEIEAKRRGEEDKLSKLHDLIIAQREEQMARDKAAEAAHTAAKAEADAKAAKDAAEKQKAAEDAAKLLAAAKKAREEAEAKAAEDAKTAKEAHEKAIAEATAAAEELKKAKEEAEKKAADEAKGKEEAEKKAAEEAAKAAEAAKPKPEEKKAPIKFKDAVGRKFSFPWHLCKTWKGMEDLIKQAFLHVDVIGQHVHEGHYDLVGPDGEIILPQVWETMVQPDWTVTMHMWPMEEPVRKSPPPPPPIPGLGPGLGPDPVWVDLPPMVPPPKNGRPGPGPGPRRPSKKGGMPPPPPPPPMAPMAPPPPMVMDMNGEPPPGITVIAPGGSGPSKPRKPKPQNVGFLRWTAGGTVRPPAGKGAKKPESPAGGGPTAAAAHGHPHASNGADAGCVVM